MTGGDRRRVVAVVAKAPRSGAAKTRLIPVLGERGAAALAEAFLRDLGSRATAIAHAHGAAAMLYYTPPDAAREMARLVPELTLRPQREGSLGDRLEGIVAELAGDGYCRIALIGSDAPTLPAHLVASCFEALDGDADVALARAADGGYVLAGMTRPQPSLFRGVPWSTARVYEVTCARVRAAGLRLHELAEWYDVDDARGLERLVGEVAAGADVPWTRLALRAHRHSIARTRRRRL